MEKRIGAVTVLATTEADIPQLNSLLSKFSHIILARQGLPLRDRGVRIISLIVEGTTDDIGAMTGQIGRFKTLQVKSVLTPYREDTGNEQLP